MTCTSASVPAREGARRLGGTVVYEEWSMRGEALAVKEPHAGTYCAPDTTPGTRGALSTPQQQPRGARRAPPPGPLS